MVVSRPNINFRTKQVVRKRESMKPYVGYEYEESLPDGWRFDIKRWCSAFDLRLPTMPRLSDPSTQGIDESVYFKPGVGSVTAGDLTIKDIEELNRNNEAHWIPIINHGHYFHYKTQFYLYGDNSRIQYIVPSENRDSRNYLELDTEPNIISPILAASFTRNPSTKTPSYKKKINQVVKFSGTYDSNNNELETVTTLGKINWDNINTDKDEFIVDNTQDGLTILRFNKDFTETIGVVPTIFQDLAASEIIGTSNGQNYQVYYLQNFPVIIDNTFHLYIEGSSTWTEWTRVDDWWDLINSTAQNRYFVDKDLGIVYFGSGINGGIPPLGKNIVVTYMTTIRVEYEQIDRSTDITAWDSDVSPITNHLNQGFVCLTHDDLEPARITLEIDKPHIAFTVSPKEYGPIYCGSDYAVLKATVTNVTGVPVPNVEVVFGMTPSTIGYIGGSVLASSITDSRGEAYSSYQPPTSADSLGFYSTIVRTSTKPGYTTTHKDVIITLPETGLAGKEDEIYLYQILKDDILQAYDSVDSWIYYNLDAPGWVVDATTYAQWKSELATKYELKDWHTVNGPSGIQSDGSISGRKVVVYKLDPTTDNYDSTAINPITGNTGAVVPVRPDLVEKIEQSGDIYENYWRAIYPKDAIPDCDPTDSNNNVGGYWLVSTRLITFSSNCYSTFYNRTVNSNGIAARISLPDYLLGEYVNSYMQKVPFGWKFLTDTDNVAAGLDGATFITVNPHSGPYQVLDLVNSTDSEEWASAPFKSIGLQVNITS